MVTVPWLPSLNRTKKGMTVNSTYVPPMPHTRESLNETMAPENTRLKPNAGRLNAVGSLCTWRGVTGWIDAVDEKGRRTFIAVTPAQARYLSITLERFAEKHGA